MRAEQTPPSPVRTSSRPATDFDSYVLRYSKAQRNNALLIATGAAMIVGAITYTHGAAMVLLVSFGIGQVLAGAVAMAIAERAHARYTEHLAVSTVTTYQEPTPAPAVRAFVPSANGAPSIRAGKFRLSRQQWVRLFQSASEGGRLTRDAAAAVKALPRELYRDWSGTLAELARIGIVDDNGVITPDGWEWYAANVSPYSTEGTAPSGAPGTPARRTHGAAGTSSANGAGVAP